MNSESESMGSVIDDLLSRSVTTSTTARGDQAHAEELVRLTEKIQEQDRTIKVSFDVFSLISFVSSNRRSTVVYAG